MKYPPGFIGHCFCRSISSSISECVWSIYSILWLHYSDVIMNMMASRITSLTIIYSTLYSGADERKYQSSASLAFVWGIHLWPVNSPHKWSVTRKMFPFDDVIMCDSLVLWQINKKRAMLKAMANWLLWNHKKRHQMPKHVFISVDVLYASYHIIPPAREMPAYRCMILWYKIKLCTVLVLFSINFHSM